MPRAVIANRQLDWEVVVSLIVVDVCGVEVVVVDAADCAFAITCSNAAVSAASTDPVGGTPSAVWKFISAVVNSGVHSPSTGPVQ